MESVFTDIWLAELSGYGKQEIANLHLRNAIVILEVTSQVFGSQIMLWLSRVAVLSKRSLLLGSHITECAT